MSVGSVLASQVAVEIHPALVVLHLAFVTIAYLFGNAIRSRHRAAGEEVRAELEDVVRTELSVAPVTWDVAKRLLEGGDDDYEDLAVALRQHGTTMTAVKALIRTGADWYEDDESVWVRARAFEALAISGADRVFLARQAEAFLRCRHGDLQEIAIACLGDVGDDTRSSLVELASELAERGHFEGGTHDFAVRNLELHR